ncbi:hypothetical protein Q2E61_06705 [Microbulbifer thermotolerans]|uniref:hypothetical protein n=2 Tax=Microbulbifer thermotolerans TaxID=252514 RepID=UPI0026738492|nr:hypothetical protein [Microbulbifer thermotolerans]WKT61881.1 hypothetical protein Q2E61_06705 [Microbulbifer thermotolerans]
MGKMKNNMRWIILILVCGITWLFFYMQQKPPLYLMAKEIVPVFSSQEDAMTLPKERAWKNLEPQQKVQVLSCVDVKHYLIYKVSLNGGVGFVNEGNYVLLRSGKPAIC